MNSELEAIIKAITKSIEDNAFDNGFRYGLNRGLKASIDKAEAYQRGFEDGKKAVLDKLKDC